MSWAVMLRLAVERLGVTPDEFWRLSLREWRMLTAPPEQAAMSRGELERLKGPAEAAAQAIEASFERAGESLSRSLARAAADGEITMQELARAVLAAINAVAGSGNGGSLGDALSQAISGAFGGSKADGGMETSGLTDRVVSEPQTGSANACPLSSGFHAATRLPPASAR